MMVHDSLRRMAPRPRSLWPNQHQTVLGLIMCMQSQRLKRQTGQPHTNGRHEFLDGYLNGLVHYSGDNSDVSVTVC